MAKVRLSDAELEMIDFGIELQRGVQRPGPPGEPPPLQFSRFDEAVEIEIPYHDELAYWADIAHAFVELAVAAYNFYQAVIAGVMWEERFLGSRLARGPAFEPRYSVDQLIQARRELEQAVRQYRE